MTLESSIPLTGAASNQPLKSHVKGSPSTESKVDLSTRPSKLEVSGADLSYVLEWIRNNGGWVSGMTAGVGKHNSVYVLTIQWSGK